MNDLQSLAAWRSGNSQAGIRVVTRHHRRVVDFVWYRLGDDDDAEPLAHRAFETLLAAHAAPESQTSFAALLYWSARKVVVDELNRRLGPGARFDPRYAAPVTRDVPATMSDERSVMVVALRRLPLDSQIVLDLHHRESMTLTELAFVTESDAASVEGWLASGRAQLEARLHELAESKEVLFPTLDSRAIWPK